jgi:rsbT co-antagonist protein RsbR
LLSLAMSLTLPGLLTKPILALTSNAERIAAGDFSGRVDDRARHELGRLGQAFNRMTAQLAAQRDAVAARTAELESSNEHQRQLLDELQASMRERDELSVTIRELSVPVIPVLPGVLAVPLVGSFDTARASELHATVLEAVEQQRAQHVLLDVTGVPVMDTQVAQMMIQLTDAIRLLGAEPTLVGVRPEVAQTLVQLGIQFNRLEVKADLQSAVVRYSSR